jgi:hypothetical protein
MEQRLHYSAVLEVSMMSPRKSPDLAKNHSASEPALLALLSAEEELGRKTVRWYLAVVELIVYHRQRDQLAVLLSRIAEQRLLLLFEMMISPVELSPSPR